MSDKELVAGCVRNDRTFQRILYDRFAPLLFAVCIRYAGNRQDAEDMLQDGLIKVFASIRQFRGEGSLEGWIKRIVINTALAHLRKAKQSFVDAAARLPEEVEAPFDGEIIERLSAAEITKVIAALPAGYRAVFNLCALDGYSHAEIAGMLHISESTSRSQLTKARNMIKAKMKTLTEVYHG
jgi:RNA polymerase sigma-70 factor (ECF subfamily)